MHDPPVALVGLWVAMPRRVRPSRCTQVCTRAVHRTGRQEPGSQGRPYCIGSPPRWKTLPPLAFIISIPRLCERCRERAAVAADPSPSPSCHPCRQWMACALLTCRYGVTGHTPHFPWADRLCACARLARTLPSPPLAGNTCLRIYGQAARHARACALETGRERIQAASGMPPASGPRQGDHSPSCMQHAMSQVVPLPQITSIRLPVTLFA